MHPRVLVTTLAALAVACGEVTPDRPLAAQSVVTPPEVRATGYAGQTTTTRFTLQHEGAGSVGYTVGFIEPAVHPGPISSWLRVGNGGQGTLGGGEQVMVDLHLTCPEAPATHAAQLEVWTEPQAAGMIVNGPLVTLECQTGP